MEQTKGEGQFCPFRISLVRMQYSHIVAPIKKKNFKYDLTVKGGKNGGTSFLVFQWKLKRRNTLQLFR